MSELSSAEQACLRGRWWTGLRSQQLILYVYHENAADAGLGYAISWDTEYGDKMFGVYPTQLSKQDFMLLLLDVPVAYRN